LITKSNFTDLNQFNITYNIYRYLNQNNHTSLINDTITDNQESHINFLV
jgi:hypothetical protein